MNERPLEVFFDDKSDVPQLSELSIKLVWQANELPDVSSTSNEPILTHTALLLLIFVGSTQV